MFSKIKTVINYNYFFGYSGKFQYSLYYYIFFLALFFAALIFRIFISGKIEKDDPRKGLVKIFFWVMSSISLTGLVLVFLRSQEIINFTRRIFVFIDLVLFLTSLLVFYIYYKRKLPQKVWEYKNKKRKEKWLPKKKK